MYLHSIWREANLGKRHGDGIWTVLEQKVQVYKAAGARVSIQREPFCIAILTPLMQRAHQLRGASETVFMDTTSTCDTTGASVTFLLVKAPTGVVSAGMMVHRGISSYGNIVLAV